MSRGKKKSDAGISLELVSIIHNQLQIALETDNMTQLHRALYFFEYILTQPDYQEQYSSLSQETKVLIEKGQAKCFKWTDSLKENDILDIYHDKDKCWYSAKIISPIHASNCRIHYIGWDVKYDEDVDLKTRVFYSYNSVTGMQSEINKFTKEQQEKIKLENLKKKELEETERLLKLAEKGEQISSNNEEVKKKGSKKKVKKEEEVEDLNDWVCCLCQMIEAPLGTELVMCDGPCRRSFHQECLSAAPSEQDTVEGISADQWFCQECKIGKSQCFCCKKYGLANMDLIKCSDSKCGKYYHIDCLNSEEYLEHFLPVKIKENVPRELNGFNARLFLANLEKNPQYQSLLLSKDSDSKITINCPGVFRCARHFCDTCYTFHGSVDVNEITPCSFCPRAFHPNCIPPGSRFNIYCLVCPLHPTIPLPDRTIAGIDMTNLTENAQNILMFYEQLTVPETMPNETDVLDNHFRLEVYIKDEVESAPINFKEISKNNYDTLPPEKLPPLKIQDYGCDCKEICGPSCHNRLSCIECSEMKTLDKTPLCCVGKNCSNRVFQKKEYADAIVFKEGKMGMGLKAASQIPKGKLVIEYMGEIIDEEEMIRRMVNQRTLTPFDKDYYIMDLGDGLFVDGKFQGNYSRFINHSCDPNCELQRWTINGRTRIGIFSVRDIEAGESFSYDYRFDTQEEDVFKCYCGTAKCRGSMAPEKKNKLVELARNQLKGDLRNKLIKMGLVNQEKKQLSSEEAYQEELSRSYTSKYLPLTTHEIKLGPLKNTFQYGREHNLFLIRNIQKSRKFLRRQELFNERILEFNKKLLQSTGKKNGSQTSSNKDANETKKRKKRSTNKTINQNNE